MAAPSSGNTDVKFQVSQPHISDTNIRIPGGHACVEASQVNGAKSLCGTDAPEEAKSGLRSDSAVYYQSLKPLGSMVHKLSLRLNIRKISKQGNSRVKSLRREGGVPVV